MKQIIIATMGEMTLKGRNRNTFETALLKAVRRRLTDLGSFRIKSLQSAVYIEPDDDLAEGNIEEAFSRCGKVFGIAALSISAVCEKNMDEIAKIAPTYLEKELKNAKTFKVNARRSDKSFPLDSMDIAREIGGVLLDAYPHLAVDVHNPELRVTVEIRERAAYVHAGAQKGAGGLPVPTSGRAALLLSGGIDSPVAAYLMAKRGLGLVAVHFASPPYTSPRAAAKVEALAQLLTPYTGPLPYYQVPYTKTQEYLRDTLRKQDYFTVIMRRSMMRIARVLCEKERCEAIVTGESLAQVASQTLQALAVTNCAQSLPVLRPCIGMDKVEITDLARKIGTYETSILPYEDCCTIFTPPHPRTRPRLDEAEKLEAAMPDLLRLEAEAAAAAAENGFQLIGG